MQSITTESDIVIVSKTYFFEMEKALESLLNEVDVKNFSTLEKFLYLRDWLSANKVNKEMRKLYPNLQWDNIRQLLPQE